MPSDMYGAVSDRSGSDGAEEPIAEYIAKAYYVTHSLQTMRFFHCADSVCRMHMLIRIFAVRDGTAKSCAIGSATFFPNAAAYLFA